MMNSLLNIGKIALGLMSLVQISALASDDFIGTPKQGAAFIRVRSSQVMSPAATRDSILDVTNLMIKTISGPKGAERDWDALKAVMVPQGQFMVARNGKVEVTPIASFLEKAPAMYGAVDFLEEALSNQVTINESVATVHQEYRCFVNGKPSHHGTNVYNLLRTDTGWKIGYLMWYQISDRKPEPAKAK